MRILVLTDNYLPEAAATSFRISEHAKTWLDAGHEVTVVTCAPNRPRGVVYDGYKNRPYSEEWIDGVRVIRVWTYMAANAGTVRRTIDYVSFAVSSAFWSWRFPRFDVILATSPQFFAAVAGWWVGALWRKPWIFEVRDLWPESIGAVGAMQGRGLRWLEKLELAMYRHATRVMPVTEAFERNLTGRGVPAEKIDVVTNGVTLDRFDPHTAPANLHEQLNLPESTFIAGYLGTTGMAHGLGTLVEVAERLRDHQDIHLVIIGDGADRDRLVRLQQERQLTNLSVLDPVAPDQVPAHLQAIDLPIVHLLLTPTFQTVLPSKMFELMAMEKPVLLGVAGEAARILDRSGGGVCVPPEDADAMANAILELKADPDRRAEYGRRGRAAVVSDFNRQHLGRLALTSLLKAAGVEVMAEPLPKAA